jgi:monoamine oxidase
MELDTGGRRTDTRDHRRDTDVVVIGAGLAGLAAARHLVAHGVDVIVLDGRDEPGGKCVQRPVRHHLADCGGGWTAPGQHHLKALAAEVGVDTHPTAVEGGRTIRLIDGTVRYLPAGEHGLPAAARREIEGVFAELERLCAQVPPGRPWDAAAARELDALTTDAWIHSRTTDPHARAAVLHYFGTAVVPPRQLSLLSAVAFVASCGGVDGLATEADELFVGGAAQVPRRVADELGDRVRLGWPVTRITWSDGRVEADGPRGPVTGQRAVVAMSPAEAVRIAFRPGLPTKRDLLQKGWVQSSLIKTNLVYDRPFWRSPDGERPAITGWTSSDAGCPRVVLDATPADAGCGVLAAFTFLEGEHEPFAVPHDVLDDPDARRRLLLDNLVLMYGPEAGSPLGVQETHWGHEPYVAGCLGGAPPGLLTQCGAALRDPVGPIHWAGAESAEVWINHLSGAVQSGVRAAAEIVEVLGGTPGAELLEEAR